jgi:hypothetical protein
MQTDTAYNLFSLATGALVGPLVAFWLGHHLGSAGRVQPTPLPAAADA